MRPLSGVRIVDFTRLLPGACATLLLADFGADVVKVEDPRGGDPLRSMPPGHPGAGLYHRLLNRNKRSITLDLRPPEVRPVIDAIVARADVVVESFRPSAARRLGVSADALTSRHPRLVHCSITGFGQTGPYAERAGHDLNYVALAGLLGLDDEAERPPEVPPVLLADVAGGGLNAAIGILASLFDRERTGRGAAIDVSMHEGALWWLMVPAARLLAEGAASISPRPLAGREACYSLYRAADGRFLAVGALEPKFWARFCERLGRPDLVPLQHVGEPLQSGLRAEIAAIVASAPRDEWLRRFEGADACVTAVNDPGAALRDPHVAARGVLIAHEGLRGIRSPVRIVSGDADLPPPRTAPPLGAHTDEVLQEAGIDASLRASLRARGLV